MSEEAKRYRVLASGARNLAKSVSEDGAKKTLHEIAEKYDRLADDSEREQHFHDF